MLDSDENDIFVHMDKKNKQFDEKECRGLVKQSGLFLRSEQVLHGEDIAK